MEKSIEKELELQNIKEPNNSLKWVLYTSSGKSMKRLLLKLDLEHIRLIECVTRDELMRFYREI